MNSLPDIAIGVDKALEHRMELAGDSSDDYSTGAGDQGIIFGYACKETPELMPMPISLAHKLVRQLASVRKQGLLGYLRPDGKAQVTVEYDNNVPIRVDTIVLSTQHSQEVERETIEKDMLEHVIKKVVPEELLDGDTVYPDQSHRPFCN